MALLKPDIICLQDGKWSKSVRVAAAIFKSNRKKLQALRLDCRLKEDGIITSWRTAPFLSFGVPCEEVDNFLFLSKELQKLGYACSSEDAAAYVPLKDRPGSSYGDSSSHHLHDSS